MAEYIEREALIAEFKRLTLGENSLIERIFADGVYAVIETFPTADVVEVVRCRECKYCFNGKCECPQWEDPYYAHFVIENDFCSYGARMDGKEQEE